MSNSGGSTNGEDEALVLRLTGDVDALTQAQFRRRADELLAHHAGRRLVVDMTDLVSIDSSGLGLLVHLQSTTRDQGLAMVLTSVPPRAQALLKRTGLDRVFRIVSDADCVDSAGSA